eukprot:Nk52_evm2s225 gene=Nk52_evmTU2s225
MSLVFLLKRLCVCHLAILSAVWLCCVCLSQGACISSTRDCDDPQPPPHTATATATSTSMLVGDPYLIQQRVRRAFTSVAIKLVNTNAYNSALLPMYFSNLREMNSHHIEGMCLFISYVTYLVSHHKKDEIKTVETVQKVLNEAKHILQGVPGPAAAVAQIAIQPQEMPENAKKFSNYKTIIERFYGAKLVDYLIAKPHVPQILKPGDLTANMALTPHKLISGLEKTCLQKSHQGSHILSYGWASYTEHGSKHGFVTKKENKDHLLQRYYHAISFFCTEDLVYLYNSNIGLKTDSLDNDGFHSANAKGEVLVWTSDDQTNAWKSFANSIASPPQTPQKVYQHPFWGFIAHTKCGKDMVSCFGEKAYDAKIFDKGNFEDLLNPNTYMTKFKGTLNFIFDFRVDERDLELPEAKHLEFSIEPHKDMLANLNQNTIALFELGWKRILVFSLDAIRNAVYVVEQSDKEVKHWFKKILGDPKSKGQENNQESDARYKCFEEAENYRTEIHYPDSMKLQIHIMKTNLKEHGYEDGITFGTNTFDDTAMKSLRALAEARSFKVVVELYETQGLKKVYKDIFGMSFEEQSQKLGDTFAKCIKSIVPDSTEADLHLMKTIHAQVHSSLFALFDLNEHIENVNKTLKESVRAMTGLLYGLMDMVFHKCTDSKFFHLMETLIVIGDVLFKGTLEETMKNLLKEAVQSMNKLENNNPFVKNQIAHLQERLNKVHVNEGIAKEIQFLYCAVFENDLVNLFSCPKDVDENSFKKLLRNVEISKNSNKEKLPDFVDSLFKSLLDPDNIIYDERLFFALYLFGAQFFTPRGMLTNMKSRMHSFLSPFKPGDLGITHDKVANYKIMMGEKVEVKTLTKQMNRNSVNPNEVMELLRDSLQEERKSSMGGLPLEVEQMLQNENDSNDHKDYHEDFPPELMDFMRERGGSSDKGANQQPQKSTKTEKK